ncbi:MAG: glycosyltransferase family 2 protein [Anaerolineae bacterium]
MEHPQIRKAVALALIPAHNEAGRIGSVVAGARLSVPVLVVDDGSTDSTAMEASAYGATVLRQSSNLGKGAALQTGFRWALQHGYPLVVTLDGDGQHDPLEIPRFLDCYGSTRADLIIGARDFAGMPFGRRLANSLGRMLFSWALGCYVADNQSGYRLASSRMMQAMLTSSERGFEFEVDMIITAVCHHYHLEWIPVRTIYAGQPSRIHALSHVLRFLHIVWRARHHRKTSLRV